MLSANTVAQKPLGSVRPALSHGGAVAMDLADLAVSAAPSAAVERSSERERQAANRTPAVNQAAGMMRRAMRAVDEGSLSMARLTFRTGGDRRRRMGVDQV